MQTTVKSPYILLIPSPAFSSSRAACPGGPLASSSADVSASEGTAESWIRTRGVKLYHIVWFKSNIYVHGGLCLVPIKLTLGHSPSQTFQRRRPTLHPGCPRPTVDHPPERKWRIPSIWYHHGLRNYFWITFYSILLIPQYTCPQLWIKPGHHSPVKLGRKHSKDHWQDPGHRNLDQQHRPSTHDPSSKTPAMQTS